MSGTSTDGISWVIFKIDTNMKYKIVSQGVLPYPQKLKRELLQVTNGINYSTELISKLNIDLGYEISDIVEKWKENIDLFVYSGHTIFHSKWTDRRKSTFQIGNIDIATFRSGIPGITDLRYSDLSSGRDGAPLVPYADSIIYGNNKIIINIGGIANLTITYENPIGFDTGPGNMMIDNMMNYFFNRDYDENGDTAYSGKISIELLRYLKKDPFVRLKPPKSTGRERYGKHFADKIIKKALSMGISPNDIIATVSEFTAWSISYNIKKFADKNFEIICAGGGCKNRYILDRIEHYTDKKIIISDDVGIPVDVRESLAFGIISAYSLFDVFGVVDRKLVYTNIPYGKITLNHLGDLIAKFLKVL